MVRWTISIFLLIFLYILFLGFMRDEGSVNLRSGIVHITNEHADLPGILSAASGGILLGILYTSSGRLWLPLSVHTGCNFFQYFFGLPVSGMDDFSYFLNASREGPAWFVGGGFGIENSLVTILLVLGLSGLLIYRVRAMGKFRRPFWKK